MKIAQKILIAVGCVALAVSAVAGIPTYKTFSTAGNAALPSQLNIPEDPNSQTRIVDVTYTSDTNNAQLVLSSGGTTFWQTATNQASSSVTNQISSTNGLAVGQTLVLNHNGTLYTNVVLTWNQSTNVASPYQGTNVVLQTGGWGVATSVGDNIYVMGQNSVTRYVGSGTNSIDGDAIYVANYGRPLTATLSPASSTNRLAVTVRYDSGQ